LNNQGVITGQLDLVDLVVFLVHLAKKAQQVLVALGVIAEHEAINFSDVHVDKEIQELFNSYDVSQAISNFSRRNPIKVLNSSQPLKDVAVELVQFHRVSIIDTNNNTILNYITQSDLIKFIFSKRELFTEKAHLTLEQLNIGTLNVVSVHDYDHVVEALKVIATKNISAVAVVNEAGRLVGDIGAHDIRCVNPGTEGFVENLLLPIKQFLQNYKTAPPVTLGIKSTLEELLNTIESKKVHRVFIVDDNQKLLGVVCLGDIIKSLLL